MEPPELLSHRRRCPPPRAGLWLLVQWLKWAVRAEQSLFTVVLKKYKRSLKGPGRSIHFLLNFFSPKFATLAGALALKLRLHLWLKIMSGSRVTGYIYCSAI